MNSSGLIIRLIDVVLILLLGFIGISDFTIKTEIKLPQGAKHGNDAVKKQAVFIRIDENKHYKIDAGDDNIKDFLKIKQVENELLKLRVQFRKENIDMVVVIDPHLDTIIQTTVNLLDVCEKYNIAKSIHYEL